LGILAFAKRNNKNNAVLKAFGTTPHVREVIVGNRKTAPAPDAGFDRACAEACAVIASEAVIRAAERRFATAGRAGKTARQTEFRSQVIQKTS
jgi:hypothetical protein